VKGGATTRLGPLVSGAGLTQAWVRTRTNGRGRPGGNTEWRGRGFGVERGTNT
jgi:hypothetical protein